MRYVCGQTDIQTTNGVLTVTVIDLWTLSLGNQLTGKLRDLAISNRGGARIVIIAGLFCGLHG